MPVNTQKRAADSALVAVPQAAKRLRNDELQIQTPQHKQLMELGVQRVSNLHSPIMKLEGHEGEIFTCEFHPDGEVLGEFQKQYQSLSDVHIHLESFQHHLDSIAKSSSGRCTAKSCRISR